MSEPNPNCPKCQGDGVIPSANWDGFPRVECDCVREKAEQEVRLQNDRDWRAKLDHVKGERDAWRDECSRLRALCKTFDKETADEAVAREQERCAQEAMRRADNHDQSCTDIASTMPFSDTQWRYHDAARTALRAFAAAIRGDDHDG